jgi:hypothetical protein
MRSERGRQRLRKAPAENPQPSGLVWDDWWVTQTPARGLIGPPICRPTAATSPVPLSAAAIARGGRSWHGPGKACTSPRRSPRLDCPG